jgi:hypothetical protein
MREILSCQRAQRPGFNGQIHNSKYNRNQSMFTQASIVALGLFLIVRGTTTGDYTSVVLGVLVAAFASCTLYRLKTGK